MGRRVFISHAVRDQKIVSSFIDFLHMGLNVDLDDVFCTSELQSIPTGSDFIEEIRKNIVDAAVVIVVITPSYFQSLFCMCEMGAAWALKHDVYPILVPPIDYNDLDRTPLRSVNAIKMNNPMDLDKMRDEFLSRGIGNSASTSRFNARKVSLLESLDTNLDKGLHSEAESDLSEPMAKEDYDIIPYKLQIQHLQQTVTRLQDSVPEPYLALSVRQESNSVILSVRNTGSTLTTIRIVSLRNDIKINCAFRPVKITSNSSQITSMENAVGFTIGHTESYDFEFPIDDQFSFSEYQWISSISLFHTDPYGRAYRSQIAYVWELVGAHKTISRDVVKECYRVNQLPSFDPFATDIRRITELEMHRAVVYQDRFRPYHSARFLSATCTTTIPGTTFTDDKSLRLLGVSFDWTGFPIFDLQIDDFVAFQLKCSVINGHELSYKVFDVGNSSPQSHLYDGLVKPRRYREYGLVPDGADDENLQQLYLHVDTYLRDSLRT